MFLNTHLYFNPFLQNFPYYVDQYWHILKVCGATGKNQLESWPKPFELLYAFEFSSFNIYRIKIIKLHPNQTILKLPPTDT